MTKNARCFFPCCGGVLAFFRARKIAHFGDNAASLFALRRGGAQSFALNKVAVETWRVVASLGSVLVPGFVPGPLNPVDGLTRRRPFSEADAALVRVLVRVGPVFGLAGAPV